MLKYPFFRDETIKDKLAAFLKGCSFSFTGEYFKYPQTKYIPLREPDLTKLKAHEIDVIDDVLNRFSHMNANQISDYSHNDVPWLLTENGDIIDYETVFYRTPTYSVRSDIGEENI